MSEKRFIVENDNNEVSIKDKVKDNYPFALAYEHIDDADNLIQECLSLVVLLNEQQEKITELEIELTDCKNRKEQLEYKNTKLIAKIDFLERVIDGEV